jgi:hypothetical protein
MGTQIINKIINTLKGGIIGKNILDVSEKDILEVIEIMYGAMNTFKGKKFDIINKFDYLMNAQLTEGFLETDHIEVRKSKIHGNGLFATRQINKGCVITFYPIHCAIDLQRIIGDKIAHYYTNDIQFNINDKYKLDISENIAIFGNPEEINNKLLLGHIINDSTSFNISDMDDSYSVDNIMKLKNKVARYILSSTNNSMMKMNDDKSIVYVIATRDIKKDDEITMSYTPPYWLETKRLLNIFEYIISNDNKFRQFIYDSYKPML